MVADIEKQYPSVTVKVVLLDLASVDSIKKASEEVGSLVDHLDVLINNAGVSMTERSPIKAPDGTTLDSSFFINHLGVFLFTTLLLPVLQASAARSPTGATRIVNVSSHGHRLSPVRFSDYAFEKGVYDVPDSEAPRKGIPDHLSKTKNGYPGFFGYAQSKTANILHAAELSRRLGRNRINIVAFSVHPGTIETELSRGLDEEGRATISKTAPHGQWKTQDQGSATTLVAAFDPKLGEVDFENGAIGYMSDCQLADDQAAPHASNAGFAKRLWEESEKMLQISAKL